MKILLFIFFLFAFQLQAQTHLKILYNDENDELIEINTIQKMTLSPSIDQINFHHIDGAVVTKNTAEIQNITLVTYTNSPPTANAGGNKVVIVGELVQLDGSLSNDPDNDPITYQWSFNSLPGGSTVSLSDPTIYNPTFVADYPGLYEIQLIVNDGILDSPPDNVTTTALAVDKTLQDLIEMVNVLPLNNGVKNSLIKKINNVIDNYNKGKNNVVLNTLTDFINQLNDLITEGTLTPEEGQPIIDYAQRIGEVINSGLYKPNNNETEIPSQYVLTQNYPNPFNPVTTISYSLPQDGFITLVVYDVIGNEVTKLVSDYKKAGIYSVQFNGEGKSSGLYLCKLTAENYTSIIKMILIK